MKKIIHFFFIVSVIFSTQIVAQVANDNCSTATALGTLGAPSACGAGTQTGTVTTVAGTLTGATPATPYLTEGPCSSGSMASPANDVWYTFVVPANGQQATISVTGAAFTPNIAAWAGSCGNLIGFGCTVGTPGSATLTITGNLIAGQTYYIQISGNTGESGAFTLNVNSFFNCGNCITGSSFTATPMPVNGMYNPGQTVQFCYHVSNYVELNTNWLHGVQVNYGSGWNAASITAVAPASCAGGGTWLWLPGGEPGTVNGQTWGQGFYYDLNNDGNTANNFGDNCSGVIASGTWVFCVTITTNNILNAGDNLNVTFNTSGDGESGSWTDNGCNPDPATIINALPNTNTTTNIKQEVTSTEQTTIYPNPAKSNFVIETNATTKQTMQVYDITGKIVLTQTIIGKTSVDVSHLNEGVYTVNIISNNSVINKRLIITK